MYCEVHLAGNATRRIERDYRELDCRTPARCSNQRGSFERLGSDEYPKGVMRPLQVRWTNAG